MLTPGGTRARPGSSSERFGLARYLVGMLRRVRTARGLPLTLKSPLLASHLKLTFVITYGLYAKHPVSVCILFGGAVLDEPKY